MTESIDVVYRDYNTMGVPESGDYRPEKPRIRALLKQLQNSGGQAITKSTFAQLNAVTPPTENYMGIVLSDPDATKNGYYSRASGLWIFERGFPDTFAELVDVAGTANAVTASVQPEIDPGNVSVYFIEPISTNTLAVTLNGLPVKDVNGNPLAAGLFPAGRLIMLVKRDTEWRLLSDPDADAAADAAAASAAVALAAAASAQGGAGGIEFDTIAIAELYAPETAPDTIRIRFFDDDFVPESGGIYVKAASEPAHDAKFFITLDDTVTDVWYGLAENRVTPQMLGSKADGTGEDTAYINSALEIGRPVWIPQGDYVIGTLLPPANTSVECHPQATFTAKTGHNAPMVTLAAGVWWQGGIYDANGEVGTSLNVFGSSADNILLKDVKILDGGQFGLFLNGSNHATIDGLTCLSSIRGGIYGQGGSYNTVRNCHIENSLSFHGIQLVGGLHHRIHDCYSFNAYEFGINLYQAGLSKIVNCHTSKTRLEGINIQDCDQCDIIGNTVEWASAGGTASADFGISVWGQGIGSPGDCNFNTVADNRISSSGKSGIAIVEHAQYNHVHGNVIIQASALGLSGEASAGIALYGTGCDNNFVSDNIVWSGTGLMDYGIYNNGTGNTIDNNKVAGWTGAAIGP